MCILCVGYITDNGCGSNETPLISTGTISPDWINTSPTTSPETLYSISPLNVSSVHEDNSTSGKIAISHDKFSHVVISDSSLVISDSSLVISHSTSHVIIHHSSLVINHSSLVISHSSFVIGHSSFVTSSCC